MYILQGIAITTVKNIWSYPYWGKSYYNFTNPTHNIMIFVLAKAQYCFCRGYIIKFFEISYVKEAEVHLWYIFVLDRTSY